MGQGRFHLFCQYCRLEALVFVNGLTDDLQIDSFTVTQAIHRLNGIITPASAAHSASDLEHQLRSSGVKALFTCASRLDIAVKAAKTVGIPQDRIFILATPDDNSKLPFTTFDDLVKEGADLPKLEPLKWVKGQGARQVAFLCYSSGTSGLPVSAKEYCYTLTHSPMAESSYDLP